MIAAILRTIAILLAVLIVEVIVAPTSIIAGILIWLATGWTLGTICDALKIGVIKL